jgi:hypothetical protein
MSTLREVPPATGHASIGSVPITASPARLPTRDARVRVVRPLVSVVLPCLNEAGSVAQVVETAREALASHAIDGEVVVADNGSTDGSQELARAAGARVVNVPIRGYGAALMGGIEAARGEICVMGDADATYPFELLPLLVAPIVGGEVDMTVGSRLGGATVRNMPFLHRYLGTPLLTWLVRRAGGPAGLSDSQSGFRAFRRDRMRDLGLRGTGMEYASEMLIVAGRSGWRIREIGTGYRERIGESKLSAVSDGLRHLRTILLLAPDLAATLPGAILALAGLVPVMWALFDPNASAASNATGSPGWLASFFGPAMVILGCQSVIVGLLLAVYSPLAPRAKISAGTLLGGYAVGGIWAICAAFILVGALVMAWVVGLPAPHRALQVQMIALILILVGASAIAASVLARLASEGFSRTTDGTARRDGSERDSGQETTSKPRIRRPLSTPRRGVPPHEP